MHISNARIAASVSQIKPASRMDFMKAVVLAVLIHIAAPLVVRYVDSNFPTHCVNQTHGDTEGTGGHR